MSLLQKLERLPETIRIDLSDLHLGICKRGDNWLVKYDVATVMSNDAIIFSSPSLETAVDHMLVAVDKFPKLNKKKGMI